MFERLFVHDSYACRKGKGTLAASDRLICFLRRITANGRRAAWALKLDVASFFPSIHKATLFEIIARRIRHPEALWLTRPLLFHDPTTSYRFQSRDARTGAPGSAAYPVPHCKSLFGKQNERGLPIGNLTSQFWGNVYLQRCITTFPSSTRRTRSTCHWMTLASRPRKSRRRRRAPRGSKVTTRIIGPDGNPVSQITITPAPVDRPPMPFPPGVTGPTLLTIQPGSAVASQQLPITFPNVQNAPPGSKADLYFLDLAIGGWNTCGTDTVSADGTQIVSDPGFGLPPLRSQVRRRSSSMRTRSTPLGVPRLDMPTSARRCPCSVRV